MRWKMTLSYLPVAARVAKFLQVCRCASASVAGADRSIESYLRGLVLEERDGDIAESRVEDNALGIVGVSTRLSAGGPGCRLGGCCGRGGLVVLLATEH